LSWNGVAKPSNHWGEELLSACEQLMRGELLAGIGDNAQEYIQIGDHAFHFMRCCSAPEIEQIKARVIGLGLKIVLGGIEAFSPRARYQAFNDFRH
jgi:hypothetical protein